MHDGVVVVMRLHGQQIPLIGFLLVSKQWGNTKQNTVTLPIAYTKYCCVAMSTSWGYAAVQIENLAKLTFVDAHSTQNFRYITVGV